VGTWLQPRAATVSVPEPAADDPGKISQTSDSVNAAWPVIAALHRIDAATCPVDAVPVNSFAKRPSVGTWLFPLLQDAANAGNDVAAEARCTAGQLMECCINGSEESSLAFSESLADDGHCQNPKEDKQLTPQAVEQDAHLPVSLQDNGQAASEIAMEAQCTTMETTVAMQAANSAPTRKALRPQEKSSVITKGVPTTLDHCMLRTAALAAMGKVAKAAIIIAVPVVIAELAWWATPPPPPPEAFI